MGCYQNVSLMRRFYLRWRLIWSEILNPACISCNLAEEQEFHECLLHVHPVLASARSLWLLHIRCADMSLR